MIYSLSKNNYSIEVSSLGAELVSLKKNGVNYLWTKSQPYWQRHAPVLFPIVGKLKNNTYSHHGTEYHLPQHGFARDSEFILVEENDDYLLFRLQNNNHPDFPFLFEFYIKYSLHLNGVTTRYYVENKDSENLPFGIGAHPGFVCPLHSGETLGDYFFEFENDDVLNRTLLHDGLLTQQSESLQLENKKLFLSEALFKMDALVLSGFQSKSVALKSENYTLKVSWADCTYLGLWKQPNAPFVCIEPWWGVTDSINSNQNILEKQGITILEPEKKREFWFRIEID